MKQFLRFLLLCLATAGVCRAELIGTTFTYQGRLQQNGQLATNGIYGLRFGLFTAHTNTNTQWPFLEQPVPITNGIFTVRLDFGVGSFSEWERWLEVSVNTNTVSPTPGYLVLTPRLRIDPAPYAIFAVTAGNVTNGAIHAPQIATTVDPSPGDVLSFNGSKLVWQPAATPGLAWSLTGNSPAGGNFLGTTNNLPLEFRANNMRVFLMEPKSTSPNLIGGWSGNSVDAAVVGATIAGGGAQTQFALPASNRVTDDFGTVGGGAHNIAGNSGGNSSDGNYATVGGGHFNIAAGIASTIAGGAENSTSNNNSFIGGGYRNIASGWICNITGGELNRASAPYGVIGGGYGNTVLNDGSFHAIGGGIYNSIHDSYFVTGGGEFPLVTNHIEVSGCTIAGGGRNTNLTTSSTIGGGSYNYISVDPNDDHTGSSTIAGGVFNKILQSDRGTIGGGSGNLIQANTSLGFTYHAIVATVGGGQNNTASGAASTVGGGNGNVAANNDTTVSGGYLNTADGLRGTVPGGELNRAGGTRSFAAGYRAKAVHDGSFVWANGNSTDITSLGNNEFRVWSPGGVRLEYPGATARWVTFGTVGGQHISTSTGAWLSDGGAWVNASDRNRKTNFGAVNPQEILRKVATLSLLRWSYTNETSTFHIGPMAQDFHAAFQLGSDEKSIATVDADGVALAAIQGLHELVQRQQATLTDYQGENAALKQELVKVKEELAAHQHATSRWETRLSALEKTLAPPAGSAAALRSDSNLAAAESR